MGGCRTEPPGRRDGEGTVSSGWGTATTHHSAPAPDTWPASTTSFPALGAPQPPASTRDPPSSDLSSNPRPNTGQKEQDAPGGLRECAPPQWSDHRRGHLPPLRMVLTVETRDNRCWPEWRERGVLGAGGGGEAVAAVADSSREGPQSFRTKLK